MNQPPIDAGPGGASVSATSLNEVRKLAAIMFTDMVGFSRLMHEDEEHGLRLLDISNELIFAAVQERRGRVLKKMGDAVLAEFPSAIDAVTCAVQIQTRLRDYNLDKHPSSQILLRIGIHVGDVVVRDQDLLGDGINVAARLEPLAEPGGVCISEAVYNAVAASSSIKPVLVGEVELKNILQRQVIYRIPSLYADPRPDEAKGAPQVRQLRFGSVRRIESLPPPSRGFVAMLLLELVSLPLAFGFGLAIGFATDPRPYEIWPWEVVDPELLVGALEVHPTPVQSRIWESLDRDTRDAIMAFDEAVGDERAEARTVRLVRRGLNRLIAATDRDLAAPPTPEANGSSATADGATRARNRRSMEEAFPGSIQRYVSEPGLGTLIARSLANMGSQLPGLSLAVILSMILTIPLGAYVMSLRTLRITFHDLRDADSLLDYYIRDLGFAAPVRKGDELVFKATLWTWMRYSVLKVRARVAGNTVLLTGPMPMMRGLTKRMLLLARTAE